MTPKQKQCLLCYLGFYTGQVDGIWGPLSKKAALTFQQAYGLPSDDTFPQDSQQKAKELVRDGTADFWRQVKNFTLEEFACKCRKCGGYPAQVNPTLVFALQKVRDHFGKPAYISSGLRCTFHNAMVGGVSNSRHLVGKAVDFTVSGAASWEIAEYAQTLPEVRYCNPIDQRYVHMDVL